MKEAEKQRKGVRHSLFKRFLMIVVILLLCMIGSFLAVDYTVRKMTESSTLSSNEKICALENPKGYKVAYDGCFFEI